MFSAANSGLVGGWSLIAGLVGLVVSVLGFYVTIKQLRRTSRATEAVNTAIGNLKNRMAAFDYATECVRASKSLEHATQLLRGRNWEEAATRLLESQSTLNRVALANEGSVEARTFAKETSDLLLEAIRELEDAADKGLDFDPKDLTLTLRKQINMLDVEFLATNKDMYDVKN
jgi:hypothetical protein